MLSKLFIASITIALSLSSAGQEQTSKPPASPVGGDFLHKAFGSSCSPAPNLPAIIVDLNGDGVDDVVIPARCKEPMMDAGEYKYTVLDPRNAFYGFGNPAITTQYSTELPEERDLAILIIQGAGPQAWKSDSPAAKFLIVNLPYKELTVKRLKVRKKTVNAIYVKEMGGDQMTSALYWDGKKYKYQPVGASME